MSAASDCRCACGALMARRTGDGIEFKCRRCKRTWLIQASDIQWVEPNLSTRPEDMIPEPQKYAGEKSPRLERVMS